MQIYRINKETDEWLKKAYDYVRTDAFCFGQNIPVELEFAGEEAQDDLENLINDTDNLYIGFEMEQLLVNWSPEEFANRVAEERPEFGDKLHELGDYALQYIDSSLMNCADHYSMMELRWKLQACGLDADMLLDL